MPKTIVYIDDEAELLELFTDFFEDQANIHTFSNPNEAVEFINSNSVDIIFIDNKIPPLTGPKILEMINSNAKKYLLSGDVNIEGQEKFDGKIEKPFNPDKILKLIS